MTTNTSFASSVMHTPLPNALAEIPADGLSSFDYDQMCLALVFIAERIHALKQKQTAHAKGEAHYEKL